MIFEYYMEENKKFSFRNTVGIPANTSSRYHQKKLKSMFLVILFSSAIFFFNSLLNVHNAVAIPTLGQSIKQFQESLESSINKEIQSIHKIADNVTNCTYNISFQSQTHSNESNDIYANNGCFDNHKFPLITMNMPIKNNLTGQITSAEYDTQSGKIVSSIYGNWSLKSDTGERINFSAFFNKESFRIDLTNQSLLPTHQINSSTNNSSLPVQSHSAVGDIKAYNLSNFRVNAIMQQNYDTTYKGTIDVTEKNISSNSANQTNTYDNLNVSISILSGRILVINFENQNNWTNEFKNIPLVGLIN